jgi:hypothetical protein
VTFNEPYPFDLARIAEVLDRHAVRYVTIGGASGMLHGVVDYLTRDVDVLIRDDQENLARLAAALTELGAVSDGPITAADFVGNTQWETNAGPVDVLVVAVGPNETVLLYADIEPRTVFFQIGDGPSIPTASLDDIIRMKEAADRHKDHQALPELRRLRGDPHPEHPLGFDPFAEFTLEDDEGEN